MTKTLEYLQKIHFSWIKVSFQNKIFLIKQSKVLMKMNYKIDKFTESLHKLD